MKLITPSLLKFAGAITLLTIVFRYFLSASISARSSAGIIVSATAYAVCMFAAGWYFGSKDSGRLPIYDVGFRFHATTYLVFTVVSELWFAAGFNSPSEGAGVVHLTALIWGIVLLMHFVMFMFSRKHSIKYIDKKELFE